MLHTLTAAAGNSAHAAPAHEPEPKDLPSPIKKLNNFRRQHQFYHCPGETTRAEHIC